jgi:hypothetical protein
MGAQTLERDTIAELGVELISFDNQVNEPRDLFTSRFPAHLKDKAPRVMRGAPCSRPTIRILRPSGRIPARSQRR